jgi:hypothetical protein
VALKIKQGEDGTLTLLVPKADEVYDTEDGQLYIPYATTPKGLEEALIEGDALEPFDIDDTITVGVREFRIVEGAEEGELALELVEPEPEGGES